VFRLRQEREEFYCPKQAVQFLFKKQNFFRHTGMLLSAVEVCTLLRSYLWKMTVKNLSFQVA